MTARRVGVTLTDTQLVALASIRDEVSSPSMSLVIRELLDVGLIKATQGDEPTTTRLRDAVQAEHEFRVSNGRQAVRSRWGGES